MILLGQVVSQRMHFSVKLNYKVMCTRKTGACEMCERSMTSDQIGKSHFEHYAPCAVQGKDRKYHQKIVVLTDSMYEGTEELAGLKSFITEGPERGHAFDLIRHSKHDFKITPVPNSPRAVAHALPPSFGILAFMRARFDLPQSPGEPLTFFAPFSLSDLGSAPGSRPVELDITVGDRRTVEDWEKTKAKIDEMKELKKGWKKDGLAPAPSTPPPAAAPAPAEPDPEPTPEPEPELETAVTGKPPGGVTQLEELKNPANFGPVVLAGVGTEEEPLIEVPDPEDRATTRAQVETLKDRREKLAAFKKAAREQRAARAAKAGADPVSQDLDAVMPTFVASANGKSKIGGAK